MSLPWPLLVLLVWERAGDGWVLGVAGAARMLPYVALSWAAGRLADRYARDRIVRLTLVARTAAAASGWPRPWRRAQTGSPWWPPPWRSRWPPRPTRPSPPPCPDSPARQDRARDQPAGDVRGRLVRGGSRAGRAAARAGHPAAGAVGRGGLPGGGVGAVRRGAAARARRRRRPEGRGRAGGAARLGRAAGRGRRGRRGERRGGQRRPGLAADERRLGRRQTRATAFGIGDHGALGFGALGGPVLGRIADRGALGRRVWLFVLAGACRRGGASIALGGRAVAGAGRRGRRAGRDRGDGVRPGCGAGPAAGERPGADRHRDGGGGAGGRPGRAGPGRRARSALVVLVAAAGSVAAVAMVRRPVVRPATVEAPQPATV